MENFQSHLPPGAQRRLSRMSIVFQPEVWDFKRFGILIFVFQAIFIIFFGVFIQYDQTLAMPHKFIQRADYLRKHTVPNVTTTVIRNGTVVVVQQQQQHAEIKTSVEPEEVGGDVHPLLNFYASNF